MTDAPEHVLMSISIHQSASVGSRREFPHPRGTITDDCLDIRHIFLKYSVVAFLAFLRRSIAVEKDY